MKNKSFARRMYEGLRYSIKDISQGYTKLNPDIKAYLKVVFVTFAIFAFVGLAVWMFFNLSGKYVSVESCEDHVRMNLQASLIAAESTPTWLKLLYTFRMPLTFLLICLGISWVFHGFQVRLFA